MYAGFRNFGFCAVFNSTHMFSSEDCCSNNHFLKNTVSEREGYAEPGRLGKASGLSLPLRPRAQPAKVLPSVCFFVGEKGTISKEDTLQAAPSGQRSR